MAGLSLMLLTGLVLGWVAGSRFTKAARGWRDFRAHKALLPGLRAAALLLTRNAVLFVALAVFVAVLALYALGRVRSLTFVGGFCAFPVRRRQPPATAAAG